MRSTSCTVLALLLVSSLAGCAKKSELEAAQAELAACREAQAGLEEEAQRWQERFDRSSTRWDSMRDSVIETVPNALAEIDAQRNRILEAVPEMVQADVSGYLDEYFDTVMQGFQLAHEDAKDIKLQLDATHRTLEALGSNTSSISQAIEATVAEERQKRQEVASALAALHQTIVAFDRDRLNCDRCPDRVKLSRKERETILGFHAELISATAALQLTLGE